MKRIGIIVGSTREGRVSISVAEHVLKIAQNNNSKKISYALIDLKTINLPMLDEPYPAAMHQYQKPHTLAWSKLIASYDGFIIVTPEYNHGYPGVLKNALDFLYTEWNNKPVAFVGYGYSANGSRSVMQLRQVANTLKLQSLAKEVLVNLGSNAKDGVFVSNENIDKEFSVLLSELEAAVSINL